jgi:hypothetical protein
MIKKLFLASIAALFLATGTANAWEPKMPIYDPTGSGIYPFGGDAYPNYGIPPQFLPPPQIPRVPKPRIEYPYEDPSPVNRGPQDVPGRRFG